MEPSAALCTPEVDSNVSNERPAMTTRQRLLLGAFLGLLMIPFGGCSNSVKLSSPRMCSATGGTYIANVCSQGTGKQATSVQLCQGHGGVYDPVLDICEVPGSSK